MDLWIVAAAAGAGYVGQQLKNLSRGTQNLSEASSECSNIVKPESSLSTRQGHDNDCRFRRLVQRKKGSENVSADREMVYQGASTEEVASASELVVEEVLNWGNYDDCNILSISTLSPGFLSNDDLSGAHGGARLNGDIGENCGDLLCADPFYGSARKRSILRTRQINPRFVKPLSSLESCLMAQLYNEHAELKEYIYSSIHSPSIPTTRPFLVTDGNRIISRANSASFGVQEKYWLGKESYSVRNETVFGVPPLPNVRPTEFQRQKKLKMGKVYGEGLSRSRRMVNGKRLNSKGTSKQTLIFCLGITVGMISSFFENKREVDKLKGLLKKTENLVQDLQEELEMKDSLTVEELATEAYESLETHEDSCNDGAPQAFSSSGQHEKFHDKKSEEESFSKIEAELEAELERLELSINSSCLEAKLSDLVELDPDFAPDVAQGELRADVFETEACAEAYAGTDRSGSSTTHSANYAVSPRQLSLKLHEVLQSRLEERVKELETELQNSQRKVQCMESRQMISLGELSDIKAGCSSINGSPIAIDEKYPVDQPVVINLSGEALDAYNEAYDEFTKMNESEEENLSPRVKNDNHQEGLHTHDQDIYWIQNDGLNQYEPYNIINNGNASEAFHHQKGRDCNSLLHDVDAGGDESDDSHDEMEKLLIKHILEKTRKGSPVVLNAQRALFSMDQSEH